MGRPVARHFITDMMWIACGMLTLLAGWLVLAPLFAKTAAGDAVTALTVAPEAAKRDYLLARKIALYRNIKDLEAEYKLDRLSEADFRQLTATYKDEAREILQKLDGFGFSAAGSAGAVISATEVRPAAGNCASCGAKLIPGKKFCADCGHPVTGE